MRIANEAEIAAIKVALADQENCHVDDLGWEPTWEYVAIIENYMPDGPSWVGKMAMFPGGEVCFITVVLFDQTGTVVTDLVTEEIVI